ncbi:MAG: YkvI family membrane protein, partial [Gammaproteobacteria bacterium]
GGYGTGQELLIFFLNFGPLAGLLGMTLIAVPLISLSAMVCYEFARVFQALDYRTFFRHLLGRAWFAWEVGFLTCLIIFFGVMGSAAGEIFVNTFQLPYWMGTLTLMALVAFLVFEGTGIIEKFMTYWSFALYTTYVVFFFWALSRFGGYLADVDWGPLDTQWISSGLRYGALQVSLLPAMLFSLHHVRSRRQALAAGLLSGPIAMVPGLLFYFVMLTHYPAVNAQVLPANFLLESLGSRSFQICFQIVLLGSLVDTGAGVIHAFNERLAGYYRDRDRDMPRPARPLIALGLMAAASLLSKLGLIALMLLAFNFLGWFFLIVFLGPLFTVGLYRLHRAVPAVSTA